MDITTILELGANAVTILGIILAIIGVIVSVRTYRSERKKESLDREYGTFHDLDDKYVDFMYECSRNPDLDLFSIPASRPRALTPERLNTERALYAVLISIFERAHVMFERRADLTIKEDQYPGWVECMRSYCTRESFLSEWQLIGTQFDAQFQKTMTSLIQEQQEANRRMESIG